MELEVLGLVLARGGSKSVPRKNVRLVGGKPLIAWTIETALQAHVLNRVIVSTDDKEIAGIAQQWGAEVPFMRPTELAQDDTPSIDTILHAVQWLGEHEGYHPHYIMLLQPTSPLRSAEDIEAVVRLVREKQADAVVSVCHVHQHPYWMKKINYDGQLTEFFPLDRIYTRRQDMPPIYFLDGALYLARREVLIERRTFYTDRTYGYVIPSERSLDIDTEWDLHLVDLILQDRIQHAGN